MIFGVSDFGTGLNSARDITETNVQFQWTDPTCNGPQVTKQCTIYSATLLYPITLENGTVTIIASSATSVDHIQPVGLPLDYFEGGMILIQTHLALLVELHSLHKTCSTPKLHNFSTSFS
jgi:hypothetical protein